MTSRIVSYRATQFTDTHKGKIEGDLLMKTVLGLFGIATVFSIGTVFSVLSMTPPEYNFARFAASIFAIFCVLTYVMWLRVTDDSLSTQIVIAVLVSIVAVVGLPVVLNWISGVEARNISAIPPAVPRNYGVISPDVKTLFSTSDSTNTYPELEIGDSGAMFSWSGQNGKPIFNFFGTELIVESIDKEIKVTAQIKDKKGQLIAELNKNEWKTASPPQAWDRNYTKDALEVIDSQGNVVLQVKALSDRIQLQGEWWDTSGNGLRFVKASDKPNTGAFVLKWHEGKAADGQRDISINRIFKYPSELHFGELR
jgi:hypothetical protein